MNLRIHHPFRPLHETARSIARVAFKLLSSPRVHGNVNVDSRSNGNSRFQSASRCAEADATSGSSDRFQAIVRERSETQGNIKDTARSGFIPANALIRQLYATHLDELAEERRQLGEWEQQLEVHLRRLDVLFPAPPPPSEPEPPQPEPATPPLPVRPRHFRLISGVFDHPTPQTRH